jgi:hypothetical protein
MLESVTVASMAMKIYRRMFLPVDLLNVVPEGGYEKLDRWDIISILFLIILTILVFFFRASTKSIKYFEWRSLAEGVDIRHAGNGSILLFKILF